MELIWRKQLSVGNAVIDSDHKNLIATARGIGRAIMAQDHGVIPQAFEFMEGWLCSHFTNEDRLACAAGLDFSRRKLAQQRSLAELRYLRDCLSDIEDAWSENTARRHVELLSSWMADHIRADMPLKPALCVLGYTFWPGGKQGEINHAAGRTAQLYLHLFDTEPMRCAA